MQQVRRDTIKTINFRGRLIDEGDQTVVRPFAKLDTIGSYIDENNHRQLVIVSNGDTFAVRMYVPKRVDTGQIQADIRTLQLMERIEGTKPCDSSLLIKGDQRPASTIAHEPKKAAPYKDTDLSGDLGFLTMVFVLMVPFSAVMLIKAGLSTIEMCSKIAKVWRHTA